MVDVSAKDVTARQATARGRIVEMTAGNARHDHAQARAKKGDVLAAARIAGIMAAKKTHPSSSRLCHPLGDLQA